MSVGQKGKTMREKLIELLIESSKTVNVAEIPKNDIEKAETIEEFAEAFNSFVIGKCVDYLIANGVTVQKWIPVTERLPELSGEYLVYCGEYDGICVLYYEILKTKGKWRSNWKEVTHWMPLPEPPRNCE